MKTEALFWDDLKITYGYLEVPAPTHACTHTCTHTYTHAGARAHTLPLSHSLSLSLSHTLSLKSPPPPLSNQIQTGYHLLHVSKYNYTVNNYVKNCIVLSFSCRIRNAS